MINMTELGRLADSAGSPFYCTPPIAPSTFFQILPRPEVRAWARVQLMFTPSSPVSLTRLGHWVFRTQNQSTLATQYYITCPCGPPLLGCLLAWTSVLAPRFLFSPLLGCCLSIKFGRVSSHAFQYGAQVGVVRSHHE